MEGSVKFRSDPIILTVIGIVVFFFVIFQAGMRHQRDLDRHEKRSTITEGSR